MNWPVCKLLWLNMPHQNGGTFFTPNVKNFSHLQMDIFQLLSLWKKHLQVWCFGIKFRAWNVMQTKCSTWLKRCCYKDWIIARFIFFFQLNVLLLGDALTLDFCKNHWMILMIVWISVLISLTESGGNFRQT